MVDGRWNVGPSAHRPYASSYEPSAMSRPNSIIMGLHSAREASMKRLRLLPVVALVVLMLTTLTALAALTAQSRRAAAPAARKPFNVVEATIPEMRSAMEQGRLTSHELVRQYLIRIATYED